MEFSHNKKKMEKMIYHVFFSCQYEKVKNYIYFLFKMYKIDKNETRLDLFH